MGVRHWSIHLLDEQTADFGVETRTEDGPRVPLDPPNLADTPQTEQVAHQ